MNNKIEYVLVDLDGTLIETDLANNMAYKEAIEVCAYENEVFIDVNGPRITRADITKIYGENEKAENIIRTKESIFYKYLPLTSLITSTMTLLHRYIDANKKLIMVTNCKTLWGVIVLQDHKLSTKSRLKRKFILCSLG